jgi:hypothetical protein
MIWILLVVIASVIFTYFASYILPKLFFRMNLLKKLNKGVGQKVVEETYGTTILFEADKSINKYVSQYLISNRNSKTILLCEIDTSIYYLDYTCVCYDRKGNVCKMITVKENVESRGVTKELVLPHSTRSVALIINHANEESFKNDINIRTKFSSLAVYGLVEAILLFGLGYFIKFCLSKNGSGVFHSSFMRDGISFGFIGLILGLVAASVLIIYATHKVNYKEVK